MDIAPFIGPVGGPALGALLAVLGIILNSHLTRSRDREQDAQKDAVHLRGEKSARLRRDFEAILVSAHTLKEEALSHNLFGRVQNTQAVNEQVNTRINDAWDDLRHAKARLLLETGTQDVLIAFDRVFEMFQYLLFLAYETNPPDALTSSIESRKVKESLDIAIERLEREMRRTLAAVENSFSEQPIGDQPPDVRQLGGLMSLQERLVSVPRVVPRRRTTEENSTARTKAEDVAKK